MLDVVVSGGGPAGLAVALRARQRGLSVRVVDRAQPPIDKACGEGIMPAGAAILAALGVHLPAGRTASFAGIRWIDDDSAAEARFSGESGVGVRRTVLHRAMVDAAREAGIECVWNTSVGGPVPGGLSTPAGDVRARFVVGADGLHSHLRRAIGLDGPAPVAGRRGIRRHFPVQPWSDCVEVYWGEHGQAYVTPVAADEIGVAILWRGAPSSFDALIQAFPAVHRRVAGLRPTSRDRGATPLQRFVRKAVAGRVALVGDAAGTADAITGDGLSMAFAEALAVVDAICQDNLSAYDEARRRLLAQPLTMTRLLLMLDRSPGLRCRVLAALASEPGLFSRLLSMHVSGAAPWPTLLAVMPRLFWRLARPRPPADRPGGAGA